MCCIGCAAFPRTSGAISARRRGGACSPSTPPSIAPKRWSDMSTASHRVCTYHGRRGASVMTAQSEAKQTTDHNEIRRWAEQHKGKPATVKNTEHGKEHAGILRIAFRDEENLEE